MPRPTRRRCRPCGLVAHARRGYGRWPPAGSAGPSRYEAGPCAADRTFKEETRHDVERFAVGEQAATTGHYDSSKRGRGGRSPRGRRWWRLERWEDVPHVRSAERLTLGERAADRMRKGMGSWTLVFAALVFLAAWMAVNGGMARAGRPPRL